MLTTHKRPPAELSDYWEILLRRRWWILLTPILVTGTTLSVVLKLPKVYRSETLILVEPQKVPAEYVKSTVSTDITDRLQTIRQEVLSRTRLQRIIDQFGLYHDQQAVSILGRVVRRRTQEDIIELMRADIGIETALGDRTVGAFRISYQGRDPALTQQVTRQIASLFIEENLKVREQQAEGTHEFIENELEKARDTLEIQEKLLREFKARKMGVLPEQRESNLQLLGQFQALLMANGDALTRAHQQKTYLESLLNILVKREAVPTKAPLEAALAARRADLMAEEPRYTSKHPDVIRLRNELKALEKQSDELSKSREVLPPPVPSDAFDQTRSQIAILEQEIKQRSKQQTEIQNKIKQMQARIETLPAVEQQLAKINRDYEVSKANYESLLAKKNASAMAAEMERRAKGEQFHILDPASYPEKPYKPNIVKLGLLGCFIGIFCGCGFAFLLEYKDESIRNEKDLVFYLPLPVLASLPLIAPRALKKEALRRSEKSEVSIGSYLRSKELAEISAKSKEKKELETGRVPSSLTQSERQPDQVLANSLFPFDGLEQPPEQAVLLRYQLPQQDGLLALEQFRIVRTRLFKLMRQEGGRRTIKTLLVSSAVEGEGKTLVAANLAFAMSQIEGLKVLLVDADLRKGGITSFLKMNPEQGLSTYLLNGKCLNDVRWEINTNLAVVPTPCIKERSAELLNRYRMYSFLNEAIANYDLVVLDAPPVLPVADAQVLASVVDGTILVVRAGLCPYKLARQAADLLKPKVIGVVLNGVERIPYQRYYNGYSDKAQKS